MDIVTGLLTDRNPFWISTLLAAALVAIATFRQGWLAAIGRGMAAILLGFCSRAALYLLFPLTPTTLDVQLYGSEAALGFPSFWAASFLQNHLWLKVICVVCYLQLPLAVAIVWVTSRQARAEFRLFPALGILGWLGYILMPAVGPAAINPHFPSDPHAALVVPDLISRNCMPSLHAAWLIALWWASVSLSWRWRWMCAVFCVLSLVWTLGLGFHYAVDLVVAVPFVYGVRAMIQGDRRVLIYMAMVGGWFLALRLEFLTDRPYAAWAIVAITLASCPALQFLWGQTANEAVGSNGEDLAEGNPSAPEPESYLA